MDINVAEIGDEMKNLKREVRANNILREFRSIS